MALTLVFVCVLTRCVFSRVVDERVSCRDGEGVSLVPTGSIPVEVGTDELVSLLD